MPYCFEDDTSKIDLDQYIGNKLATQFQAMKAYVDAVVANIPPGLKSYDFWTSEQIYGQYYSLDQDDEHLFDLNFTTPDNVKPIGIVGFDTGGIRASVSHCELIDNGNNYYTVRMALINYSIGGAQVKPRATVLFMRSDRND